jgi:hypothetical protein
MAGIAGGTTKSASMPGAMEPFVCSSNVAKAPATVYAWRASFTLIAWRCVFRAGTGALSDCYLDTFNGSYAETGQSELKTIGIPR